MELYVYVCAHTIIDYMIVLSFNMVFFKEMTELITRAAISHLLLHELQKCTPEIINQIIIVYDIDLIPVSKEWIQ